jgi:hypothetical protein
MMYLLLGDSRKKHNLLDCSQINGLLVVDKSQFDRAFIVENEFRYASQLRI